MSENIMLGMPWVRPISNQSDLDAVTAAANADNHHAVCPTHVVEKDGQIVGYASIGAIPMITAWVDTQKVKARESIGLLNLLENLAAGAGFKVICVPCTESSPFRNYMHGLGYVGVGEANLHLKSLERK